MDPTSVANLYYDAWINRAGDMSAVPLAEDFVFRGAGGELRRRRRVPADGHAGVHVSPTFTVVPFPPEIEKLTNLGRHLVCRIDFDGILEVVQDGHGLSFVG
jgi:hypothetical protein